MNLNDLMTTLNTFDPALPLVFHVGDERIGAGYHITELRHAATTGIDCGGQIETADEVRLQLLDGGGDTHMALGKFRAIAGKSLEQLPQLAEPDLMVEFAPNNRGLRVMALGLPEVSDGEVRIGLRDARAVCKPALRYAAMVDAVPAQPAQQTGCCGSDAPSSAPSACCG